MTFWSDLISISECIKRGVVIMNVSEAQKKAQKRYDEKNRERRSYLKSRSSARSFIRNKATLDDLIELEQMIKEKREELSQ